MPGSVFLLAEERQCCDNRTVRFLSNMPAGGASTLASGLSAANSVNIFGQGDFRHYICLVGFSALCFRQLYRLAVDNLGGPIVRPMGAGR